jgi:hypothetical protein
MLRSAAPPVGDDPTGLLDKQHAYGPIEKPRLLKVAREPPAGDMRAGVGGAAHDPDCPDRTPAVSPAGRSSPESYGGSA